MSWEKLDAGSVLSHTFDLEAKEKGLFSGAPAHITFRILSSAVLLEAYSTPLFPLDILADKPAESNLEMVDETNPKAKRLLAAYGQKVSVVSIVAFVCCTHNFTIQVQQFKRKQEEALTYLTIWFCTITIYNNKSIGRLCYKYQGTLICVNFKLYPYKNVTNIPDAGELYLPLDYSKTSTSKPV